MLSSRSGSKTWFIMVPLLVVLILTFIVVSNKLPLMGLGSSPTFSVNQYQVKLPFLNPDKSYTLTLNFAKLEGVEEKKNFLNNYTILHLRPFYGQNGDIAGDQTFDVVLPNSLPSSLSYNNGQFYPSQFQTMTGSNLSLQITINQVKENYTASDVKGWALIYVQ